MCSAVVQQQVTSCVVVEVQRHGAEQAAASTTLVVHPVAQAAVVAVGIQGVPGVAGPIGPAGGQALSCTSGEVLSALRIVYEDGFGKVRLLGADDDAHIFSMLGLTLTAADENQPVNVQRSGVIEDAAWRWTPGQRVYLGLQGQLVHAPQDQGFDVLIGQALSGTRLLLSIQDPIDLAGE